MSTFAASGCCAASTTCEPGLMMPAFSRGDLGDRGTQQMGVVEVDRADHGHRGVHHVSGVQSATQPDLDHGHVDPVPGQTLHAPMR